MLINIMKNKIIASSHWIHQNFLWIVLSLYTIAIIFPNFGKEIRDISFGNLVWLDQSSVKLSLPLLMLSFLLFNAGLGVKNKELKMIIKQPGILFSGLLGNLLVPLFFIFVAHFLGMFWHNPDEMQNILVGLAIIASMPIASSSTAWTQNTDGNLALSLGLVVCSTLFSSFSTPIVLHAVGFMTTGDYKEDLHELGDGGTGAFIIFSIVLPSLMGMIFHNLIGEQKANEIKPFFKFINSIVLMLLIYSNAAISLPQAVANPDWDFLILIALVTLSLCVITFACGWLIAKVFKCGKAEQSSMMFGLGMNNNGAALVLASMALADHPLIMIPIVFYNLAQQLIASIVSKWLDFTVHSNGIKNHEINIGGRD